MGCALWINSGGVGVCLEARRWWPGTSCELSSIGTADTPARCCSAQGTLELSNPRIPGAELSLVVLLPYLLPYYRSTSSTPVSVALPC